MVPNKEEVLAQLDRILQSRTLHGAESLRAFLRFVVLKHQNEEQVHLKEYTIAMEVFGRDASYDPRTDSVVRVQAGRLRAKLHEYYTTEGKFDKILIDLPKGHYAPAVSYQTVADSVNGNSGSSTAESAEARPLPAARVFLSDGKNRVILGLVGLVAVLLVVTMVYWVEINRLRRLPPAVEASGLDPSLLAVWQGFLPSNKPTLVAYSNTIFQGTPDHGMRLWRPLGAPGQGLLGFSLAQKNPGTGAPDEGITNHYTGIGEVTGVYYLGSLFWKSNHPFRIKRSLLLNWDDFKAENIVMLGSPAENLLLRELPQDHDFVFGVFQDEHKRERYGIINRRPKPGEQQIYAATEEGPSSNQVTEDYALISQVRGLDPDRRLMILAGIKTFGTQAAAEYVTKPEYVQELISRLNISGHPQSPQLPPYYQILLRVKVNDGVPVQVSYVTHHVLK